MANRRRKQDTSVLLARSYASHPIKGAGNLNYKSMPSRDTIDRITIQRSIDKIQKSIKASNTSLAKAKSSVRRLVKEVTGGFEREYVPRNNSSLNNPFSRYGVLSQVTKLKPRRKTTSDPVYIKGNSNAPGMDPTAVDPRFTGDFHRDMADVPPSHIYTQDELEHRMRTTGFFHPNSQEAFNADKFNGPNGRRHPAVGAGHPYDPNLYSNNLFSPNYVGGSKNYRPDYLERPREYRPGFIDHPRGELPEYSKALMRDIPEYAKTTLREIPDYAKTSIRDATEFSDRLGDMPEYVRTIERDIPDFIESPREFRAGYIECPSEYRPEYIERSRSLIPEYPGSSRIPDYVGSFTKADYIRSSSKADYIGSSSKVDYVGSSSKLDYIGSSTKADYIGTSRSFISEHPSSSMKKLDYPVRSNTVDPDYEVTFRQFRPDYVHNPIVYEEEDREKSSLKFEDLLTDAPRTEYHESTPSIDIEEPKINFRHVDEVMRRIHRRTNNFFFDRNFSPPPVRNRPFGDDESQTEDFAKRALWKLNPSEVCRDLMKNLEILVTSAAKSPDYYCRDKCNSTESFPESVAPFMKRYNMADFTSYAMSEDSDSSEDSDKKAEREKSDRYQLRLFLYKNFHIYNNKRILELANLKPINVHRAKDQEVKEDKRAELNGANGMAIDAKNHKALNRLTNGKGVDKHTDNRIVDLTTGNVIKTYSKAHTKDIKSYSNGRKKEKEKVDEVQDYIQRHKHIFNGDSSRIPAEDYIAKHQNQHQLQVKDQVQHQAQLQQHNQPQLKGQFQSKNSHIFNANTGCVRLDERLQDQQKLQQIRKQLQQLQQQQHQQQQQQQQQNQVKRKHRYVLNGDSSCIRVEEPTLEERQKQRQQLREQQLQQRQQLQLREQQPQLQEEQRESNKRKRPSMFFSTGVSELDLQELSLDGSPARQRSERTLEDDLYDISTISAKRALRKLDTSSKLVTSYNAYDEFMLADSEDYAFIDTRFGRILYSPKIQDDKYMYRFIVLSNEAQNVVEMLSRCSKTVAGGTYNYKRLLSETQIMHELGIRMSGGWHHYFYFKNGHKELILRKAL